MVNKGFGTIPSSPEILRKIVGKAYKEKCLLNIMIDKYEITVMSADGRTDRKKIPRPKITKDFLERYEKWMKQKPQPELEFLEE